MKYIFQIKHGTFQASNLVRRIRTDRRLLRQVFHFLLLFSICFLLPVTSARASFSEKLNTIHFNSRSFDYGYPPHQDFRYTEYEGKRAQGYGQFRLKSSDEPTPEQSRANADRQQKKIEELLRSAGLAMSKEDWPQARKLYAEALASGLKNGSVSNRLRVLNRSVIRPGQQDAAFTVLLKTYLSGIDALESDKNDDAQKLFLEVYQDMKAGFLREFAAYQLACVAEKWLDYKHEAELFQQFLTEFPRSSEREAALIMQARCTVLSSVADAHQIQTGKNALAMLLKEFPKTRFKRSARGLQARIDYLEERYEKASDAYFSLGDLPSVVIVVKSLTGKKLAASQARLFCAYLRELRVRKTYPGYEQTNIGIDKLQKQLLPEAAPFLTANILREPALADAYFYYRINFTDCKPADLKSLSRLADAISARHPEVRFSPQISTRIAEVYYQNHQYPRALEWVIRAIQTSPDYDRAYFVRGGTLHKLNRLTEARNDFHALLSRFPNSALRTGAREEAAVLAEQNGDNGEALDHYFNLQYQADIAYLLDVSMTTGEMKAYMRNYTDSRFMPDDIGMYVDRYDAKKRLSSTRNQLVSYALGMRYLREGRWAESERWFKSIPAANYAGLSFGRKSWADKPSPEPLTVVRDLRNLEHAAQTAGSSEARANALFKFASYYYTHGTLLLYNPSLWRGERSFDFTEFWGSSTGKHPDAAVVRRHMYEHEVYVHVRDICLDLIRRYPRSTVAPQAYYRAGCACSKLANLNAWWRDGESKTHDFWKEAGHLMKKMATRYPHHPLAKEASKYSKVFVRESRDHWSNYSRYAKMNKFERMFVTTVETGVGAPAKGAAQAHISWTNDTPQPSTIRSESGR